MNRLSRRNFALGAAGLGAALALPTRQVNAAPLVEIVPPKISDPSNYIAYVETACKTGPFFIYTCEFDASWAVLKTFGIDATLEDQLALIDIDRRIEPYYEWTATGPVIYGGDIKRAYSGNYTNNFLARTTGPVMKKLFRQYGLRAVQVSTRERLEDHLRVGRIVWIKMTVDFLDWVDATWITPEGEQFRVVFSNDHAAIVIGYNDDVVVIRDVLGPTDTNWGRLYEYEVPWDTFMRSWGAQSLDGVAVGRHADSDDED
jgi:hypothetical protein